MLALLSSYFTVLYEFVSLQSFSQSVLVLPFYLLLPVGVVGLLKLLKDSICSL